MGEAKAIEARTLRIWPGVALVILQWSLWKGLPLISSTMTGEMIAAFGGMICGLLVVLWWLFLSRARWVDRLVGAALLVGLIVGTKQFTHETVATAGMGFMYFLYAIPVLSLAFVAWAVLTRRLASGGGRRRRGALGGASGVAEDRRGYVADPGGAAGPARGVGFGDRSSLNPSRRLA